MKKIKSIVLITMTAISTITLLCISYLWDYKNSGDGASTLPASCISSLNTLKKSSPNSSDNCDIRRWYLQQIDRIPITDEKLDIANIDLKTRAQCAFTLRHQTRVSARKMMPSKVDIVLLRLRDWIKYGQPDGPTFDQLATKTIDSSTEKTVVWNNIIASAQRTNQQVNESCGL